MSKLAYKWYDMAIFQVERTEDFLLVDEVRYVIS